MEPLGSNLAVVSPSSPYTFIRWFAPAKPFAFGKAPI